MTKSKETFNKKEKEKKRQKKQQEKAQKKEDRKAGYKKGKSLDEMMAYVDADGNITSTPTDPTQKRIFSQEDIRISTPKEVALTEEELTRTGIVTRFNDEKGYGFIRDQGNNQDVIFHINQVQGEIRERDKVSFKTEKGPKGISAIEVKVIQ
jgi:cold shock CspA family protein